MTWKVMEELLPARHMPGTVGERDNMGETGRQLPPLMCVCTQSLTHLCTSTQTCKHQQFLTDLEQKAEMQIKGQLQLKEPGEKERPTPAQSTVTEEVCLSWVLSEQ